MTTQTTQTTQTASPALPTVGTPGFYTSGSDRYPCTVVSVSRSGHRIVVEQDNQKVVSGSGQDGSAKYEFSRNPGGPNRVYTRRQDGSYRGAGGSYSRLVLGEWDAYYDPHF